jgi:hypothetical protein
MDRDDRWGLAGLVVAMIAAAIFLLWETRGMTLGIDEWSFGYAYHTGHSLHEFFAPYNGHLLVVPLIIYKAVLEIFGIHGTLWLRFLNIGFHLTVCACVYFYMRPLVGPLPALAASILMLFLGSGSDIISETHGLANTLAIASGLAGWLLLGRRNTLADVLAALLFLVGVCSNAFGLPFCIGAIAIVLLDRESPRSRLWVPLAPLLAYGIWWLVEGRGSGVFVIADVAGLPSFFYDSLAAAAAAVSGTFTSPGAQGSSFILGPGEALVGAGLVLFVVAIGTGRYRPPRAAIPVVVATLASLLLTGVVADEERLPQSSRYVYVGVVLLLLLLGQLIAASPYRRQGALALAVICLVGLLPNFRELTYAGTFFRDQANRNRALLGAVELGRGAIPPETEIETAANSETGNIYDLGFSVATYDIAKERFGTPAFSRRQIEASDPVIRGEVDAFLVRTLPVALRPEGGKAPFRGNPHPASQNAQLTFHGDCLFYKPTFTGAFMTLELPPSGLWIKVSPGPAAAVVVKRFGDGYEQSLGELIGGTGATLSLPESPASKGWSALISAQQPVRVCGAQRLPPS